MFASNAIMWPMINDVGTDDPNLYLRVARCNEVACKECGGPVEPELAHTCVACWMMLHPFDNGLHP